MSDGETPEKAIQNTQEVTRREYLGHTVNFKTAKHFKDSHIHYVDPDDWVVFPNTQEPIIEQHSFDMVQKMRDNVKRWPNGWGDAHPLTGLVFCADCGGPLYEHRVDNYKARPKFVCGNYPRKICASGHRIDVDDLLKIVSETLKAIRKTIDMDRDAFVKAIEDTVNSQQTDEVKKQQRKRLSECQRRQADLEKLLSKHDGRTCISERRRFSKISTPDENPFYGRSVDSGRFSPSYNQR